MKYHNNLYDILELQSVEQPEKPALITSRHGRDSIWTYKELRMVADDVASQLVKSGLTVGNTVLVLCPVSKELYAVILALFKLGITAMFIEPGISSKKMNQYFAYKQPDAWIASLEATFLQLYCNDLRQVLLKLCLNNWFPGTTTLTVARRTSQLLRAQVSTVQDKALQDKDHPALITFTSGSTGSPKAISRSQAFLLRQHEILTQEFNFCRKNTQLTALPFFVLSNLASGMTTIIPDCCLRKPGLIDPAPILGQIERLRPNQILAAPAFLAKLVQYCQASEKKLFAVESVFAGGAPIFPGLLRKLQLVAPAARLVCVYGSSEAEPISYFCGDKISDSDWRAMLAGKGLLVGKTVSCLTAAIVDPLKILKIKNTKLTSQAFKQICQPQGVAGEIVVTGHHVVQEYLQGIRNDKTKLKVENVIWHRTGDLGYFDSCGKLWLLGRTNAKIVDEFGTMYPFSLEAVLSEIPRVKHSAVISAFGRRLLLIEPQDWKRLPDLLPVRDIIENYAIAETRFVRYLPMDSRHNSKVSYAELYKFISSPLATYPLDPLRRPRYPQLLVSPLDNTLGCRRHLIRSSPAISSLIAFVSAVIACYTYILIFRCLR